MRNAVIPNRKFTVAACLAALLALSSPIFGQRAIAGETKIRLMLEELNNVGSVMMIAAHPDDENTALLAYLARGRHVRTGYLSLTRGEGGQNLIGSEQSDELGVIRTEELLAARRIDGAEQFFTRAIDFGFTKSADETLGTKWPRDKVLGDVVWAIRRFRPDVIILRFSGTPRDGHGQHQASALLGKEAFTAAGDSTKFPEQLKYVKPWQAQRLMTNLAGFGPEQEKELAKIPDKLEMDLGAYSPELGYSYNEIAGMSRSQHRSQAMGTAERRGSQINYFVTDRGDRAVKDMLEGINLGWSRLPGGAAIGERITQIASAFEPLHPEASVPMLTALRPSIEAIARDTKDPIADRKLKELDEAIATTAGVWAEALTDKYAVTPGSNIKVTLSALLRSPGEVTISGARLIGIDGVPVPSIAAAQLVPNKASQYPVTIKIPENQPFNQPYWLQLPKDSAMYTLPDPSKLGDPENAPLLQAEFHLKIHGVDITLVRPVEHRYVDRVYGELTRPLAIVPPVAVDFGGRALVFPDPSSRQIEVPVRANTGKVAGDVGLELPAGWKADPASQHFELSGAEEQVSLNFTVTPPAGESEGVLHAIATVDGRRIPYNLRVIDYPHIRAQTLLPLAEAHLVRSDIKTLAKTVGYVMGAGDEIPLALRQIGIDVTLLSPEDLAHSDLAKYDAVVTGVRAFNTRPDLRANYQRLFKYAEEGGTLVVQYNTPENGPGGTALESPLLAHVGPYPIKTGRDRVTVEEAPVTFPNPQVRLLHVPNEITQRDFDGWIQERGLNFPAEWDSRYQPVAETHDPGEKPLNGGLLYTKYGKGAYINTSFVWFRELPGGVPGAFRIFANLISAAKAQ